MDRPLYEYVASLTTSEVMATLIHKDAEITRLNERIEELEEKLKWEELRGRGLDKPIVFTSEDKSKTILND